MAESKPKPKIKKEAEPMPKQKPEVRRKNFNEVALGYSEEQAKTEANRCLQCPKPQCVTGCPVEISIPEFIKLLREGKYEEAAKKIKEKNSLPSGLRSSVPAGGAVPEILHSGQGWRACEHWQVGAVAG